MISLGKSTKKLSEQKGLMLKALASMADLQASSYSKMESGQRGISVEALDKITVFFGIAIDAVDTSKIERRCFN